MGPERILPAQQFAFTSDPNNDGRAGNDNTYAIGDEVLVQVTFSTDVTVTGSPRLELNVGGGDGKPAGSPGSQTIAENRLVPEDGILHAGLPMVPGLFLPATPTDLRDPSDRAIACP